MAQPSAKSRLDPTRPPSWRLERVLQMLSPENRSRPLRPEPGDDEYILQLRAFKLLLDFGRWGQDEAERQRWLAQQEPGLYFAYHIFAGREGDEQYRAALIEARILSGQRPEEIAAAMDLRADIPQWYQRLFFDVHDRLQCQDFILDQVIRPALARDLAAPQTESPLPIQVPLGLLRLLAYCGGATVLEQLTTGFQRDQQPASAAQVDAWLRRQIAGQAALQGTLALHKPVEPGQTPALLNLLCRLQPGNNGGQDAPLSVLSPGTAPKKRTQPRRGRRRDKPAAPRGPGDAKAREPWPQAVTIP